MSIEKKSGFSFSGKTSVIALLFALLAFTFMVVTKHHYVRLTADSMLYVSLAQKYISGDWSNAINGYWGPLLAWLLVPFFFLGTSAVFAMNALNLVLGLAIIYGVWRLSYRINMSETIRSIIIIAFIPIVLKFSLVQPMDTLLLCMLIYYLLIIFSEDYPSKLSNGIFSGIFGALAYFSKAYAFPFFIVHFFIMTILHFFRNTTKEKRVKVLKNAVAGFVIFAIISGAWIATISDKYGFFTFSTMRQTNFNAPDPESMGGGLEFGVPVFSEGFYEPPNETAFVIWEDPSYLRGKPWSAFDSLYYFKHFIKLLLKNISECLKILETFSTLSIAIIITCLLLLFARPLNSWLRDGALLYFLFTMVLFSGGYALFHFEERYLWLTNVLLLIVGGFALHSILRKDFFSGKLSRFILMSVFFLSFIFTPSKYVVQAGGGGMDSLMYYISTDLTKHDISGNIASNREYVPVHDAWHKTFRLAYWLDSRYYGQPREGVSDLELQKELEENNISHYFFWGETNKPQFLSQYKELTEGEIPGLRVYSLKEKIQTSPEPADQSEATSEELSEVPSEVPSLNNLSE